MVPSKRWAPSSNQRLPPLTYLRPEATAAPFRADPIATVKVAGSLLFATLVFSTFYVARVGLRRRAISHGANFLSRLLLRVSVRDATSGLRPYSRRAAEAIVSGTHTTGFEFLVESVLVAQQRDFSFAEAHITFVGREAGRSKFRGEDILDFLRFLVKAAIRRGISSKRRDAG